MKIFLSALETKKDLPRFIVEKGVRMKYNLMSYYAIQKKSGEGAAEYIRDHSEEVMVDSGAHSFQKGVKVDWDGYTERYAEFIRRFDRPNVVGFFEMDVDNVIGYAKVLELRSVLLAASDKIIPVWHCGRGVADFKGDVQTLPGQGRGDNRVQEPGHKGRTVCDVPQGGPQMELPSALSGHDEEGDTGQGPLRLCGQQLMATDVRIRQGSWGQQAPRQGLLAERQPKGSVSQLP